MPYSHAKQLIILIINLYFITKVVAITVLFENSILTITKLTKYLQEEVVQLNVI